MEAIDVLYTPLDVPEPPEYDPSELKKWIDDNYNSLQGYRDMLSKMGASSENVIENYPFDLCVVYINDVGLGPGWTNGFDSKFPELSEYLLTFMGQNPNDIGCILLAPMKRKYVGYGFWHRDVDEGLRIYLDFEGIDKDKLLMKRTKIPYTKDNFVPFTTPISDKTHEEFFQEEILDCRIKSKTQGFFLNSYRGIHNTYTDDESVGKLRIPAFILGKLGNNLQFDKTIDDLIVRSAKKFEDYAVLWKEEKEKK